MYARLVMKGGLVMDSKSMMELTKELDAEFDNLVNNCMTSGAIDLNLYQEYDVKRLRR